LFAGGSGLLIRTSARNLLEVVSKLTPEQNLKIKSCGDLPLLKPFNILQV
jgi:hypothetical protein